MAEEDLIFGKNRHLFGGIEPSNMLKFSVAESNGKVSITATLPKDTIIDNQTLCSVGGAVIRRSTSGYPENEFDGDLVKDITSSGTFVDSTSDSSSTYFYRAFPYSKQGVYNRSYTNNTAFYEPRQWEYLFGYDLDMVASDPGGRVYYPSDVDNANYDPAYMGSAAFNYGSWPSYSGQKFMPKPCALFQDGTVYGYLLDENYGKLEDGTDSEINMQALGFNVMMEWPKIYTKRWVENGVYKFRCSDYKIDSGYECWCNYDKNNIVKDHFYTSVYGACEFSSTLRSLSGQSSYYTGGSATDEVTKATANGNGWYTGVLADHLLIQDLLVMMAGTTHLQTTFGFGNVGSTSIVKAGDMDTKGLFWGDIGDRTKGVKVFGMENYWGNIERRIAGWICYNGTQKIKITRGTHDGSTASDYNTTGSGYITVSNSTPSGTSGGYINKMTVTNYGRLPISASGSSTTFEADGFKFNNSAVTYSCVGGSNNGVYLPGPFYTNLNNESSYSSAGSLGTTLSYK